MEQHPVPKNVLTVEFKLFGALSVKQFFKVFIGCVVALIAFVLPLHPILKYPTIVIAIGLGAGFALIPGFDVKVSGLLRAIFVSPRYVWRKDARIPELLEKTPDKTAQQSKNKVTRTAAQELDDLSIDQILIARSQVLPAMNSQPTNGNTPAIYSRPIDGEMDYFSKFYEEEFGVSTLEKSLADRPAAPVSVVNGLAGASTSATKIPIGQTMQANIKMINNSAPRPFSPPVATSQQNVTPNLVENYQQELQMLQSQLQQLAKNGDDEAKRQQIMGRIDEIYRAINPAAANTQKLQPIKSPTQDLPGVPTKLVYGIVVDKNDVPLQGAEVVIMTKDGKPLIQNVQSRSDGSFAIDAPLTPGEYVVRITHQDHKFYDFKIVINNSKLPGYKFRPR